ncbi:hypothetical protein [Streptomyces hokutonensis]|uniref:hypothetical protein n=1 Tax=Streptomyces hokutonensis TaxID=1306990 RepID=UPI0033DE683A
MRRTRLVRRPRAAAQVALEQDWFASTDTATARIETAGKEFPGGDRDADFARLRNTYRRLLVVDGRLRPGRTRKPSQPSSARRRRCGTTPPTRAGAPPHHASALRAAESVDDPLLAREALRHLGDHDHDADP